MEGVAARLGLRRHDSTQRLAELGVVILSCDFRFCHRVQTRVDDDDPQNRILIVGAVQFITSTAEMLAIHEDLLAALGIFRSSVTPSLVSASPAKAAPNSENFC